MAKLNDYYIRGNIMLTTSGEAIYYLLDGDLVNGLMIHD